MGVRLLLALLCVGLGAAADSGVRQVSWSVELTKLQEWNTSEIQIPMSVESGNPDWSVRLIDSVPLQSAHTSNNNTGTHNNNNTQRASTDWRLQTRPCSTNASLQQTVAAVWSGGLLRPTRENDEERVREVRLGKTGCVEGVGRFGLQAADGVLLLLLPEEDKEEAEAVVVVVRVGDERARECVVDGLLFRAVERVVGVLAGFERLKDGVSTIYHLVIKLAEQPILRVMRITGLDGSTCTISFQDLRFVDYLGSQAQFTYGYSNFLVWKKSGIEEIKTVTGTNGTQLDVKVSTLLRWQASDLAIIGVCLTEENIAYSLNNRGILKCYDGSKNCMKDYKFGIVGLESVMKMACSQKGGFSALIQIQIALGFELRAVSCKDPGFSQSSQLMFGNRCISSLISTSPSKHDNIDSYRFQNLAARENQPLLSPPMPSMIAIESNPTDSLLLQIPSKLLLTTTNLGSTRPQVTVHLRATTGSPPQSLTLLPTVLTKPQSTLHIDRLVGYSRFGHRPQEDADQSAGWQLEAQLNADLQIDHVLGVKASGLPNLGDTPGLRLQQRWSKSSQSNERITVPPGWELIDLYLAENKFSVKLAQEKITGGYMLLLSYHEADVITEVGIFDLASVLLPHSSARIISAGYSPKILTTTEPVTKDLQVAISTADTYSTFSVHHAVFRLQLSSPPALLSTRHLQRTNIRGELPLPMHLRTWWQLDPSPTPNSSSELFPLLCVFSPSSRSLQLRVYGGLQLLFAPVLAATGFVLQGANTRPKLFTLLFMPASSSLSSSSSLLSSSSNAKGLRVGSVDYGGDGGLQPAGPEDGFASERVRWWPLRGEGAPALGERDWKAVECLPGSGQNWREVVCVLAGESAVKAHLEIDLNEQEVNLLSVTEYEQVESWTFDQIILLNSSVLGFKTVGNFAQRTNFIAVMHQFEQTKEKAHIRNAIGYFYSNETAIEPSSKGYLSGLLEIGMPLSKVSVLKCYDSSDKGPIVDLLLFGASFGVLDRIQLISVSLKSQLFAVSYGSSDTKRQLTKPEPLQTEMAQSDQNATIAKILSSEITVYYPFKAESKAKVCDILGEKAKTWLSNYLNSRRSSSSSGFFVYLMILATVALVFTLVLGWFLIRRRGFRGGSRSSNNWSINDDSVTDERSLLPILPESPSDPQIDSHRSKPKSQ